MKTLFRIFSLLIFVSCNNPTSKPTESKSIFTDSVDSKSYVELGGEKQYVEIKSSSSKNPVLLFIHGGPGWPQTPHLRYFNSELTKSFILVAWEQSGCGKSLMNNSNPKNVSINQLIEDAHELTLILKNKFHQDKIYLAGFSWGSVIGLNLIKKYPNDYVTYFGISQVINLKQSIELSRNWIKNLAVLKKDNAMLKLVKRLEIKDTLYCKNDFECFLKKYELLTKYGGAIYSKAAETEIKIAETKYQDYKNYDWFNGLKFSFDKLGNDLFETNLSNIDKIDVPIYFLMGRHDWSLPTSVTVNYFNKLTAPKKEIIWFENSGHEPLEEEPNLFNQTLIDRILK